MKLINKEDLISVIENNLTLDRDKKVSMDLVLMVLDDVPELAVDTKENAEWVLPKECEDVGIRECSKCGFHTLRYDYKFCPMCGRHMERRD